MTEVGQAVWQSLLPILLYGLLLLVAILLGAGIIGLISWRRPPQQRR